MIAATAWPALRGCATTHRRALGISAMIAGRQAEAWGILRKAVAAYVVAMLAMAGAWAQTMVVLETELGEISIEVYEERAPISSASFLAHVDGGYLDRGAFYRSVTVENDNGSPTIEVIQGGLIGGESQLPTVEHESTAVTGILHENGVVSLGRTDPGTATGAAFFICIGDQPGLDFGATRNPDGLGFAAFGRVVDGMDVVRAIHRREANGPSDSPYTEGQILTEYVGIVSAYRQSPAADD